ncbi:hypothetical protein LSTR_LSTR003479 [Laodelphax striatellus]|uniref:Peptidase S26 domain-containing protein n=1 Tax=Laodelphax striatellus TaxID=195883 RepID=A0A482WYU5_LAOST|nr:hypothetical protein LSTR_LSTR003479 [Laodelphax striatellus]
MNQFKSCFTKITGFVSCLVQASCVAHCALEYGGDFVVCSGPSMEPTILTDNVILSEHVSPRLRRIKQGDIVIAKSPVNPTQFICKRVTGLPGDRMRSTFTYNVEEEEKEEKKEEEGGRKKRRRRGKKKRRGGGRRGGGGEKRRGGEEEEGEEEEEEGEEEEKEEEEEGEEEKEEEMEEEEEEEEKEEEKEEKEKEEGRRRRGRRKR